MRPLIHRPLTVAAGWLAGALALRANRRARRRLGDPGARRRPQPAVGERSGASFADGRWKYAPATTARALASPVVAEGYAVSVDLDGTVSVARRRQRQARLEQDGSAARCKGRRPSRTAASSCRRIGGKLMAFGSADGKALWTADLGGMTLSLAGAAGERHRPLGRVPAAPGGPARRGDRGARLAERAGDRPAGQQLARGGGRPGGRRKQRRPLLCLRRRDGDVALGLSG